MTAAREGDRCFWVTERARVLGFTAALCLRCGQRRNIHSEAELENGQCPLGLAQDDNNEPEQERDEWQQ